MHQMKLNFFREISIESFSPIVVTDANIESGCRVIFANPAFCKMTGYTLDELIGNTLQKLQGPDTDQNVISHLRECLINGEFFLGSTINYKKDGSPYTVLWNISPIRDNNQKIIYYVSYQQDISLLIKFEKKNTLLARALDIVDQPMFLLDQNFNITFSNSAFKILISNLLDIPFESFPNSINLSSDKNYFFNQIKRAIKSKHYLFISMIENKQSLTFYIEVKISIVDQDNNYSKSYIVVLNDISTSVKREQKLIKILNQDKLTGLKNRTYGEKLLKKSYLKALKNKKPLSILFLDIDKFKDINDKYGHSTGDRVLQSIALILKNSFKNRDHIIRWGGEEFIILIKKSSPELAKELAERIRRNIEEYTDSEVGKITTSIGVATLNENETTEDLIRRADVALYKAKNSGRNRIEISEESYY